MTELAGHRFSRAARGVLERAIAMADDAGLDFVSVEHLAFALADLHPQLIGGIASPEARLDRRLSVTNDRLATLTTTILEATTAMATIADLTAAAQALAASEGALASEVTNLAGSVDALAAVVANLRANGSLSVADQQALDAAVQELTDTSTALVGETQNLQRTQGVADDAANPPQG